ncbi:EF-hand domain-containing protein [Rhodobium gokarnense]|uniref:EF-hand domain-containing protein n=1 Tax=Rhodobium gokarnense TaxID=364296 RepID=A0ABT3HG55_9HYPH|nr:EF-hand domain-containing protein [Rhodobium gokarnense]MCW2309385.1 hypothetical protein [Rhodobium gokarnense]
MKRKTILALSLVTATVVGGAFAIPALAGGWGPGNCGGGMRGPGAWGHGAWGPGTGGPGAMMQQQGGMPGGQWGNMPGPRGRAMHGRMGFGPRGGMGPMNSAVFRAFDTDKDGTVSADEIEKGVASLQKKFDTDGNGTLSFPEFQALHAEVTRDFARRPFQMMDRNADGQVSADELRFPAQMLARFAPYDIGAGDTIGTPPADAPDAK